MTTGIELIQAERKRQIEAEGYVPEHDAVHTKSQLQKAGQCYLQAAFRGDNLPPPEDWPWEPQWWKPGTPKRMLEKAGALFLAEADRLRVLQGIKPFAMPERVFTLLAERVDECARLLDDIIFQEEA